MVSVRVRDEDVGDRFSIKGTFQRLHVGRKIRTRVDDGNVAIADDVGAGAVVGERRWIIGDYATNQRRESVDNAVLEFHFTNEGDGHADTFSRVSSL